MDVFDVFVMFSRDLEPRTPVRFPAEKKNGVMVAFKGIPSHCLMEPPEFNPGEPKP